MLPLLMLVNVSSSSDDSGETVRMLTVAISTKPKYHVLAHLIHNKGQVWYLIVSIPDLCPLSYFAC